MRVLLVDGDHREGDVVAAQLGERGHEVVRCFGADDLHLCRGVHVHEECPLHGHDVDVAVLVRDQDRPPQLREMGAVCAIRHRIPVVEAYAHDEAPFAEYVAQGGTAVVEAVEVAGGPERPDHVKAIEAALTSVPAVKQLNAMPAISAVKDGKRLLVTLEVPTSVSQDGVHAIVTWATRAAREYDPYVPVIDVVVRRS